MSLEDAAWIISMFGAGCLGYMITWFIFKKISNRQSKQKEEECNTLHIHYVEDEF